MKLKKECSTEATGLKRSKYGAAEWFNKWGGNCDLNTMNNKCYNDN